MKIKDIEQIVKYHIGISDKELDDIDEHSTGWGSVGKVKTMFDSFSVGNGFMFLGCSLTKGDGLEEYETWPWIVGEHFDVKVWNLGNSGEGDDVCFMNAVRWIPKLKPKVVCMLIPPPGRFKFFDYTENLKEDFYNFKSWIPKSPNFSFLFNVKFMYLLTLKNIMGIKLICDEYNIPFITESCDGKKIEMKLDVRAKDGIHPGPKWQKEVADYFVKEIEKCI